MTFFEWKWTKIQRGWKSSIMKKIVQIFTLQTKYLVRKFVVFIKGVHNVLLVKVRAMVRDLYNLIILSGSSNLYLVSKCSFWVLNPKVKKFFEISWFYSIHLMILEKMRSCLWGLQLGFWTNGLIGFLGPSGPNVVSGS